MTSHFIDRLNGNPTDQVPFWLMRQAGRYLPEYQTVRAKAGGFFELVDNPQMASEVTLQPIERFDMSAAIIFSDILVIPRALGVKVELIESKGPVLDILTSPAQVDSLQPNASTWQPTLDALRLTRTALAPEKALIGFAGAPWTIAQYLTTSNPSKGSLTASSWAHQSPEQWQQLMQTIVNITIEYCLAQIEAGADAIQLFDSWAGTCPQPLIQSNVIAPMLAICNGIKAKHPDVPILLFARGVNEPVLRDLLLANEGLFKAFNGLQLDERINMPAFAERHAKLLGDIALQGNLDPALLLTSPEIITEHVQQLKASMANFPRWIFNLGHGVNKETPPENVAALAAALRN